MNDITNLPSPLDAPSMMRTLLVELCANLESELNNQALMERREPNNRVEFRSWAQYDPTIEPIKGHKLTGRMLWMTAEVLVKGKSIFKESACIPEDQYTQVEVNRIYMRLIREIFNYGIMSAKHVIDNRPEP